MKHPPRLLELAKRIDILTEQVRAFKATRADLERKIDLYTDAQLNIIQELVDELKGKT